MSEMQIKEIAVIGAGTMGSGIAQICALSGMKVTLFDIKEEFIEKGISKIAGNLDKGIEKGKVSEAQKSECLSNINKETSLDKVRADFLIEAVVEDLNVKSEIFNVLQENNKTSILASNTSSLPITKIGSTLKDPSRLVGMHFFNPAHIMKLVEVVSGVDTLPEIANSTFQLAKQIGKTPVYAQDSPGFIVNRVARHFYVESLKVLEEGICDYKTLDRLIESSGFKMGPFRLMDLIGVDANFNVTRTMYEQFHFEGKFRPNRIQEQKVNAGHWGRKSGKGFYDYE